MDRDAGEIRIMLYVSLISSTILLLAVNWVVFRVRNPVAPAVSLSLALSLGPLFVFCLLPPVAMQGLLLCAIVIIWRARSRAEGDSRSAANRVRQHENRLSRHRTRSNPGGCDSVVGPDARRAPFRKTPVNPN
jgi:hypothetical protein